MPTLPVPIAGGSQTATIDDVFTLDGTGSYDPDGFDIDTYTWSFLYTPPGSAATLEDADTASPTFTPDVVGTYRIFLVVVTTDGRTSAASATQAVTTAFTHVSVLTPIRDWVIPARGQKDWDAELYEILLEMDSIVPALTGVEYSALMESPEGTLAFKSIHQSMIVPSLDISAFAKTGATSVEVGATVTNPAFTATYNHAPTTACIVDDQGSASVDVIGTPEGFTYVHAYTKNSYGQSVLFTLTANDGYGADTATATVQWLQKVFYGVGAAGGTTEAFIEGLATNALTSTKNRTFTVTAGGAEKIYYAYRTAYGGATFTVGGFTGGFVQVSSTISVTNAFGFAENYTLYESDNVGLGLTTVTVS